ncbi:alpha/beta fold hydrolase [Actinoalloteichus hymeniacidonis]|uniref:Hydrolase or acyltransferase of alpha/beta superfamily n=1 Tax=Actinoalloteichus hymeniacidonis TaxID=340345 RepID=A0AAC9HS85_9PSEU|nr:alpha/beta hydrolase [Actinoalloteichus hymeniacidonis]AOS64226.1 putative hydrolase or acyltransferase of alpha/beta superfamily [Actinoalloteichus hymeniacidonis]MBB5907706.1 pimeloyl-ACP methyl ester carboxylesterase [Actinoalloteichus hymeniacidonis]
MPNTTTNNPGIGVTRLGVGPPLALAHGAGGSVQANFSELIAESSGSRTLIGVDYPGSGAVPRPATDLTLPALADQLVAAAISAGFERFPIVGVSLGSAVALTAAARHPDRITALALTVGFLTADAQLRQFAALYQSLAASGEDQALARMLLLTCSSPTTLATLASGGDDDAVAAIVDGSPADSAAQLGLACRTDARAAAATITVPTAVFVSGQDRVVLPVSTRRLAGAIQEATLIEYPDAGHIFSAAEERVWAGHVREFLADHGR